MPSASARMDGKAQDVFQAAPATARNARSTRMSAVRILSGLFAGAFSPRPNSSQPPLPAPPSSQSAPQPQSPTGAGPPAAATGAMTAEEFARATGLSVVAFSDADDDRISAATDYFSIAPKTKRPSDSIHSSTTTASSASSLSSLRNAPSWRRSSTLSGTTHSIAASGPPLDLSIFLPPEVQSPPIFVSSAAAAEWAATRANFVANASQLRPPALVAVAASPSSAVHTNAHGSGAAVPHLTHFGHPQFSRMTSSVNTIGASASPLARLADVNTRLHGRRHSEGTLLVPHSLAAGRSSSGDSTLSDASTIDSNASETLRRGRFTVTRELSSHWRPARQRTVSRFRIVDPVADSDEKSDAMNQSSFSQPSSPSQSSNYVPLSRSPLAPSVNSSIARPASPLQLPPQGVVTARKSVSKRQESIDSGVHMIN